MCIGTDAELELLPRRSRGPLAMAGSIAGASRQGRRRAGGASIRAAARLEERGQPTRPRKRAHTGGVASTAAGLGHPPPPVVALGAASHAGVFLRRLVLSSLPRLDGGARPHLRAAGVTKDPRAPWTARRRAAAGAGCRSQGGTPLRRGGRQRAAGPTATLSPPASSAPGSPPSPDPRGHRLSTKSAPDIWPRSDGGATPHAASPARLRGFNRVRSPRID